MISDTCRSLLANARRFSTTYGPGFFNHFSMALLALERLGGDEARLRQFAAFYEKRLRLKSAGEPSLPDGDWRAALGARQYEAALAAKFEDDLRDLGKDALLREVVPSLTSGIASEAFHGAIRVAYAVDSGDDVDVAEGLAAWVTGFSELPGGPAVTRFDNVAAAFEALAADDRLPATIEGRSISGRIETVNALPPFDGYRSAIIQVPLPDLAKIATQLYIASEDFTALHLVTACHAVRLLQPYLSSDALDALATAMLASYVVIGRPPISGNVAPEARDSSALAALAVKRDDDHDLKLVYSCLQEETKYGWGLHRAAAAVRLGLVRI